MKKRRRQPARSKRIGEPLWWFPIDTRLLPSILTFTHVKGLPKLFLQIELVLASLIVIGSLLIVVLKLILTVL